MGEEMLVMELSSTPQSSLPSASNVSYDDMVLDSKDDDWMISSIDLPKSSSLSIWKASLHILLHPVYGLPCPYLRVWNSSGSLLPADIIQQRLADFRQRQVDDSKRTIVMPIQDRDEWDIKMTSSDSTSELRLQDLFGLLLDDDHPIYGRPYVTIHMCELEKYMLAATNRNGQIMSNAEDQFSLLSWLTIVGPYLGLSISPKEFQEAIRRLSEITS